MVDGSKDVFEAIKSRCVLRIKDIFGSIPINEELTSEIASVIDDTVDSAANFARHQVSDYFRWKKNMADRKKEEISGS